MLGWRLLLSSILIPLLIGVFVLDAKAGPQAPWLLGLCLLLAIRGAWEMVSLLRHRVAAVSFPLVAICSVAVIAAGWVQRFFPVENATSAVGSLGPVMVAHSLVVLVLLLAGAVRYREPGASITTMGAELLAICYVGMLLSVTAQLRWVAGAEAGYLVLGSLVIAAKCGDVGAYTLGRLFGRKKMVPRLSPGKTWMGGLGAVLGAGLGAWAWIHFATPRFHDGWTPPGWYWSVCYGAMIGVAGLVGDLCESLIKRDAGQKDSAALLPGFGGLLDLLDSVLFAGPVAYVLWLIIPLKTW